MSSDRIERLKALGAKAAQRKSNNGNGGRRSYGDPRLFPFFMIGVDQKSTLRFIADKDEANNPNIYYVEQMYYEWKFNDPQNPGNTLKVKMPCRNMYKPKSCPVYRTISNMFDRGDKVEGGKVWIKRSYLMNGFVRQSDFVEEPASELKIRGFDVNKRLFQESIEAALSETDPDSPNMLVYPDPMDYEQGIDFIVRKTQGPQFPSYSTSAFARRSSPLTDDERAALVSEGPIDLKELRMKEPANEAAYDLQPIMLEACLNGEPWDETWEEFWTPIRGRTEEDEEGKGSAMSKPISKMAKELPIVETAPDAPTAAVTPAAATAPAATAPAGETKKLTTQELLAKIQRGKTPAAT